MFPNLDGLFILFSSYGKISLFIDKKSHAGVLTGSILRVNMPKIDTTSDSKLNNHSALKSLTYKPGLQYKMSSNKNTAKMTTTTTTKKTAAPKKEEVAAVVPAPVAAAAPKAAKVTKAAAAPVAVSTASAAVVAPVAVAAAAEPEAEVNLVAEFNAQVTKVNELRNTLGLVLADMKKLEKRLAREIKKAGRRRRSKAPQLDEAGNPLPKKPSVFTRPQKITDDLCVFLGKPKGTEMCRSDVTRGIMDYVKKHGLNNKQDINPDAALRKLLKSTEAEKVTILNLQRYLKNHYVKAPVAVVPA